MTAGVKIKVHGGGAYASFFCPACNHAHLVRIAGHGAWRWNGRMDRPTFSPSVRVVGGMLNGEWSDDGVVCHVYVIDGSIHYYPDSTHALTGQQVPLPDWPLKEGT